MAKQHRGYELITGPDAPPQEHDTKTCCHCNGVIRLEPMRPVDEVLEFCARCNNYCHKEKNACRHPSTGEPLLECLPYERWLDAQDREGERALQRARELGQAVGPVVVERPGIFECWPVPGLAGEVAAGLTCALVEPAAHKTVALFFDRPMATVVQPRLNRRPGALVVLGNEERFTLQESVSDKARQVVQTTAPGQHRYVVVNKMANCPVCVCFEEAVAAQIAALLNEREQEAGARWPS